LHYVDAELKAVRSPAEIRIFAPSARAVYDFVRNDDGRTENRNRSLWPGEYESSLKTFEASHSVTQTQRLPLQDLSVTAGAFTISTTDYFNNEYRSLADREYLHFFYAAAVQQAVVGAKRSGSGTLVSRRYDEVDAFDVYFVRTDDPFLSRHFPNAATPSAGGAARDIQ